MPKGRPKSDENKAKTSSVGLTSSRRFSYKQLLMIVALFVPVGVYVVSQGLAATSTSIKGLHDNKIRGINHKGLKYVSEGQCKGSYVPVNYHSKHAKSPICLHPDPGPEGADVTKRKDPEKFAKETANTVKPVNDTSSPAQPSNAVKWPCEGDGQNGYRFQAVYAYVAGRPNRLSQLLPYLKTFAKTTEGVYATSSEEQGQERLIRFATTPGCDLTVSATSVTPGNQDDWGRLATELENKGYNREDRKYLVWLDDNSSCGVGGMYEDETPSPSGNWNNFGPSFAVVWNGCWNYGESHEVMHTLGAVNPNSPHHTLFGHCYDQHDVMCYDDGSKIPMQTLCELQYQIWILDCGKNDYYSHNPPAGSYLATHWNTANNQFLTIAKPRHTVTVTIPGADNRQFQSATFCLTASVTPNANLAFVGFRIGNKVVQANLSTFGYTYCASPDTYDRNYQVQAFAIDQSGEATFSIPRQNIGIYRPNSVTYVHPTTKFDDFGNTGINVFHMSCNETYNIPPGNVHYTDSGTTFGAAAVVNVFRWDRFFFNNPVGETIRSLNYAQGAPSARVDLRHERVRDKNGIVRDAIKWHVYGPNSIRISGADC